jgi:hypothetical protein
MRGFQRGDVIFSHGGSAYYLRLTLGALAEICAVSECDNAEGLAQILRLKKPELIAKFLIALGRPAHGDITFKNIDMGTAMTALANVFERAFAPLSQQSPAHE